jgi:hypothetical protein
MPSVTDSLIDNSVVLNINILHDKCLELVIIGSSALRVGQAYALHTTSLWKIRSSFTY